MSIKKFAFPALGRSSLIARILAGASGTHAEKAAIASQSLEKLKTSMSCLDTLKLFQMHSESSIEVGMQSGKK